MFDWWTDLQPDDSRLVKPLKKRTILSKTPSLIVLLDEEEMYFRKMTFQVKVHLERPNRWISEYQSKEATAISEYSLETQNNGSTLLSYHTEITPTGFLTRLFSPLVRVFVKRVFASEMKIFIQTLEHDFKRQKKWPMKKA